MTRIISVRDEVLAEVRTWRKDATNLVLIALTIAGFAAGLCAILGSFALAPSQLMLGFAVLGALVVALATRRQHYRWRATILLVSLYVLAIDQLAVNGLVGDGRIALLVLPLLALILLGATEGWIAACVTATILIAFVLLAANGLPHSGNDIQEKSVHPGFWLLQVLLLLGALIPLMLLFTRFLAQQMRVMVTERQTRRELEDESATRQHLQAEIMRVGEDERRRLGSELHDGLCQHLTAALLHCTVVENQLADRNVRETGPAMRLRTIIEESIGMAYDVSKGLCPLDLNPDALISALERLARQTHETSALACEFRRQGEAAIRDPQRALHLFRIAQEAVANAVKHAHGRVIEVELSSTADSLTLRVQDDGVGRYDEADTKVGGMGLQLMAHRAGAIGGTLTIEHPNFGGTLVTCRVPAETRTAV